MSNETKKFKEHREASVIIAKASGGKLKHRKLKLSENNIRKFSDSEGCIDWEKFCLHFQSKGWEVLDVKYPSVVEVAVEVMEGEVKNIYSSANSLRVVVHDADYYANSGEFSQQINELYSEMGLNKYCSQFFSDKGDEINPDLN